MAVCGFIGQGLIGQKRLSSIEKLNEDISFIVDPLCQSSNYNLYKDISDIPDELIDITTHLFIAIPHNKIYETFSFFSERIANFLIEKPLGINYSESIEIDKLSKVNNNNIFCGFNYRYLPHIQSLKSDLDKGESGEIYYCSFSLSHGGRPEMSKEWKMKKSMAGGGALIDPGVHLFDLMNYLFNPKIEVISSTLENFFWRSCDVEDFAKVILKDMNTGTVFDFEINLINWKNNFEIKVFGKEKTYFLDGRGGNYGDQAYNAIPRWHWQSSDNKRERTNFGNKDNSFFQETKDFLNPSNSNIIAQASSGLDALEIVDKIYR